MSTFTRTPGPHTYPTSVGNYTSQEESVKTRLVMVAMVVTRTPPALTMEPWFNTLPGEGIDEVVACTNV